MLLIAVWSEVAHVNLGTETGQAFANRALQELPGLGSDPRLLTSLRQELPLLAEAAPDPLLSALEHMLGGDGAAILPIFREQPGFLHPTSEHTGVLWALETLAWDPEYFRRAVLILARLATIDPGGTLGNRPDNSLAEIFVLWNPNTNASSIQRVAVLDEIVRAYPKVGWKLILRLLPTTHGTSSPTSKPKLREAGAADRTPITYKELWSNQALVCGRAITLAGNDPSHWSQLVGFLASFPPPEREQALHALDETLRRLDGKEGRALWTKIRDEVLRHERFKTAGWALSDAELSPFKDLVEKYAPTDPIAALVTLFDDWTLDVGGNLAKANQRRAFALKQLYADAGADAVVRLATEARNPYLVVEAADSAGFQSAQVAELLSLSFNQNPESTFTLTLSGLYRKVAGELPATFWLRQLLDRQKARPQLIGALLQAWPDGRETWRVARSFGKEVVEAYWTRRPPRYVSGSRSDLLRSSLMLLRYGRAIAAIQSSLDRLPEVPTELLIRMLDGVIPELNAGEGASPDAMTSFYLEKALEALDQRGDVGEVDIATREYQFFPVLEHSGRQLRIYQVMAREPGLFHQILRNVYLANGEEKGQVDARAKANASLSYRLLSKFDVLPGQGESGVDGAALSAWIDEFRRLGIETDRPEVTDSYVGRVLAHAPPDPDDGAWPHRTVRSEIERLACDEVERALRIERFNMRGVHGRGVYEGGDQERELAKAALDAAGASAAWPRTAALLRAIGRTWEEEAKRADLDAAQRRLKS